MDGVEDDLAAEVARARACGPARLGLARDDREWAAQTSGVLPSDKGGAGTEHEHIGPMEDTAGVVSSSNTSSASLSSPSSKMTETMAPFGEARARTASRTRTGSGGGRSSRNDLLVTSIRPGCGELLVPARRRARLVPAAPVGGHGSRTTPVAARASAPPARAGRGHSRQADAGWRSPPSTTTTRPVGPHSRSRGHGRRDLVGEMMHDGARMHEVDLATEDGPHVVVLDVAVRAPSPTQRHRTRRRGPESPFAWRLRTVDGVHHAGRADLLGEEHRSCRRRRTRHRRPTSRASTPATRGAGAAVGPRAPGVRPCARRSRPSRLRASGRAYRAPRLPRGRATE